MYSDDPDTSFLNELNERLCNEFDAGVHTDPTAATWLLDAHRRIDEVIEKAQTSEPLSSPTLVRGRHLRAAVCSRLLRICTSPDEKQALAEQGLDDETEAMRILRELVLQGHAEWRPVLADVIHRTLVLVELHPQLSFALATRAESIFASSLRLFGPQEPSVVSTAARLASTFGRAALRLHSQTMLRRARRPVRRYWARCAGPKSQSIGLRPRPTQPRVTPPQSSWSVYGTA